MLELDIDDLASDGRGVARGARKAIFVSGALPGEKVRAQILKPHRQYDDAAVVEVLQASPDRVLPRCPHTQVCSGCSLQHMAPQAQILAKQKHLLDALERLGKVQPERLLPPLQRDVWAYRRKARLSVRFVEKKGRALVGFREANGKYVADIRSCAVLDTRVGERLAALSELVSTMDARSQIPQIEVAAAQDVVLVFRHLAPLSSADSQRLRDFGASHAMTIVLQPGGLDSLQGLDGEAAPELCYQPQPDLNLHYLPLDFVQVNDSLNQAMLGQALELLRPGPQDLVLDLFCGIGNFTLPLARRAAGVVGVEGDAALVARARQNAEGNGIFNAEFHVADLFQPHRGAAWAQADYRCVLLDPPRAGAEELLRHLNLGGVERLLYVSCHPATLARDAAILVRERGLVLEAAGVMDMFPHTAHVESMALFRRP